MSAQAAAAEFYGADFVARDHWRIPLVRRSVNVGHARVDHVTGEEAVEHICDLAASGEWSQLVVTPNIHHVVELERNPEFRRAYDAAALTLADGWPVARAARRRGARGQQRVTGADLLPAVCAAAAERGLTVGFIGGQPRAAELCAARLEARFPTLDVVFVHPAPVGFDQSTDQLQSLLDGISARRPNILFVGLGAPRQEVFIHRNKPKANVVIAVGAALDYSSGIRRRAPRVVQHMGLEWLFRIASEPRRLWRRYVRAYPAFLRITR